MSADQQSGTENTETLWHMAYNETTTFCGAAIYATALYQGKAVKQKRVFLACSERDTTCLWCLTALKTLKKEAVAANQEMDTTLGKLSKENQSLSKENEALSRDYENLLEEFDVLQATQAKDREKIVSLEADYQRRKQAEIELRGAAAKQSKVVTAAIAYVEAKDLASSLSYEGDLVQVVKEYLVETPRYVRQGLGIEKLKQTGQHMASVGEKYSAIGSSDRVTVVDRELTDIGHGNPHGYLYTYRVSYEGNDGVSRTFPTFLETGTWNFVGEAEVTLEEAMEAMAKLKAVQAELLARADQAKLDEEAGIPLQEHHQALGEELIAWLEEYQEVLKQLRKHLGLEGVRRYMFMTYGSYIQEEELIGFLARKI